MKMPGRKERLLQEKYVTVEDGASDRGKKIVVK
jgi:hypothetical protein